MVPLIELRDRVISAPASKHLSRPFTKRDCLMTDKSCVSVSTLVRARFAFWWYYFETTSSDKMKVDLVFVILCTHERITLNINLHNSILRI